MGTTIKKDIFERVRAVKRALADCRLCPRNCGIDRTAGEKGYCRVDARVRCFREILYYGEEAEISPTHQIHFPGCNLKCEYCLVMEWNESPASAQLMNFEDMAQRIAFRKGQGVKTLSFLGGEPTVNLHGVLELLSRLDSAIKVVWNSNMYYNDITGDILEDLIDVYLADFKCGDAQCAKTLLGADDYIGVVKRNILRAAEHANVIVRHVILPGHRKCCAEPIFQWLASEIPDVKLSLRTNYIPPASCVNAPSNYVEAREMQRIIELAQNLGLKLVR